jgi:ribosomal protein S18 acetylase RimI-like enzyme
MDYSFIIRRAVPSDAAAVKAITDDAFARYAASVGIASAIEALNDTVADTENDIRTKDVFIALIDDMPVGSIRVRMQDDGSAYISRLGVKTGYGNIGIGKSMMNLIDKLLIRQGVKIVRLHAASENYDLIRFYYGRGFHVDSTTKDRGYIRALMEKKLPHAS